MNWTGEIKMKSEQLAWKIRRHAIEMTHLSGGSHIGAIMSVADIIAVLYSEVMKFDSISPQWAERDRFILSKGHAGAAIYAALAENGFFEVEELKTHYANGSRLSGHVSHHLPGVDFSTGSLGHGLSAGAGMAYAAKKDGREYKVYVVLGDGECDEGSVWEAALFANHFRLNNLVAIVDHNHMQSLDFQENTLEIEDFGSKWRAFGWNAVEINGNNHEELKAAFLQADKNSKEENHKPTVIIANTIKGYGVSFMQNDILWHYRFPHDGWEYDCAVNELHQNMPEGVEDIYTPNGIENPVLPTEQDDIGNDHTFSCTWNSTYPEKMRRVEAKSGSGEREHRI
jgi:transketolase